MRIPKASAAGSEERRLTTSAMVRHVKARASIIVVHQPYTFAAQP